MTSVERPKTTPAFEKLVSLASGHFSQEVRMAAVRRKWNGSSPLTIIETLRLHTSLEKKGHSFPLAELVSLGVAVPGRGGPDYHIRLQPVAGLILVLGKDRQIRNQAAVLEKGERAKLSCLGQCLSHLIINSLENNQLPASNGNSPGALTSPERSYLEICLKDLKSAGLTCSCGGCQNFLHPDLTKTESDLS